MAAIINVILPVFAIMLAGYLAGRFRLIGASGSEPLSRFVFYIAMPALIFASGGGKPNGPGHRCSRLRWDCRFGLSRVSACFGR